MTPTAKHSKTPWQDNEAGLIYGQVSGDEDEAPFVCDVCDSPLDYTDQEKANAALIVRACNSYRDMLEALEFVQMTFADMEASKRKGYYTECPQIVSAAIAKATQE